MCPECKGHVSDRTESCPLCGFPAKQARADAELLEDARNSANWVAWAICGGVFFVLCKFIQEWLCTPYNVSTHHFTGLYIVMFVLGMIFGVGVMGFHVMAAWFRKQ
jgi:hypothetical protein